MTLLSVWRIERRDPDAGPVGSVAQLENEVEYKYKKLPADQKDQFRWADRLIESE